MEVLRLRAFCHEGAGGNPAGVVLDASGLSDERMQQIAAEVGYAETAFLIAEGPGQYRARYFAPLTEVDFCGHATVAAGAALAEAIGNGDFALTTNAGPVTVRGEFSGGARRAELVTVPPRQRPLPAAVLAELLAVLGWTSGSLDPALRATVAYAGAWHPVLVNLRAKALDTLDYDFDRLRALCVEHGWTTVHLAHRLDPTLHRVRNAFPLGGLVEDPATGAAGAAYAGYLGALGLVLPGRPITLLQGPPDSLSELRVTYQGSGVGVRVAGTVLPV